MQRAEQCVSLEEQSLRSRADNRARSHRRVFHLPRSWQSVGMPRRGFPTLVRSLTYLLVVLMVVVAGCTSSNPVVAPSDAGATDVAVVDASTGDGSSDTGIPAPTNVVAVRGDGVVTVSWDPPPVNVIWYAVASSPGGFAVK